MAGAGVVVGACILRVNWRGAEQNSSAQKLFFSSDLLIESGDSSRTNFRTSNAFGAHWISAAMNALAALLREVRGQTNGQEMMRAARARRWMRRGTVLEPRSGSAPEVSKIQQLAAEPKPAPGASLCWYLPEAIKVTAHSCWLPAASL